MRSQAIRSSSCQAFLLCCAVLVVPRTVAAQHRGGGGGSPSMGGLSSYSRPDGVDEGDGLKDFHRAVAVQATGPQIAAFQEMIKATSAAEDRLRAWSAGNGKTVSSAALEQGFAEARLRNKQFQDGFSEAQKAGLRERSKRLEKADADLDQEFKRFAQALPADGSGADLPAHATGLEKALSDFSLEQLALGRDMSIMLATGQDQVFNLPKVRNQVKVGANELTLEVSGQLSETTAEADRRSFRLESILDLSDLQRSITPVMNAQLASNGCGVRLSVRRATLGAATPASSLVLQLHYERWSCTRSFGQTELAEADGSVEIKLTPAVDQAGALSLNSEFKRIDASGMMADDLRSGDLGDLVRDKVSAALLLSIRSGADFGTTLPGVLKNGVTLESARFQDPGSSGLKAVLAGRVTLSSEQANQLASQLNQTLSAQGTPGPASGTPAPGAADPKLPSRQ
jgi:hypothetical protein